MSDDHIPDEEDDDIWEDWAEAEAGEYIVTPVTPDAKPFFAPVYGLGHLLWICVVWGLLALSGMAVHYLVLLGALGGGVALFAMESHPWRRFGWAAWLTALFGSYRWLGAENPTDMPWWGAPSLILVIVGCAYTLWRRGRARLKRERPNAPLNIR